MQPSLSPTELMAAHCHGYVLTCPITTRTARSPTSVEYFGAFPITPTSQVSESPPNPRRFNRYMGENPWYRRKGRAALILPSPSRQ